MRNALEGKAEIQGDECSVFSDVSIHIWLVWKPLTAMYSVIVSYYYIQYIESINSFYFNV
jgi:hypothetical protein